MAKRIRLLRLCVICLQCRHGETEPTSPAGSCVWTVRVKVDVIVYLLGPRPATEVPRSRCWRLKLGGLFGCGLATPRTATTTATSSSTTCTLAARCGARVRYFHRPWLESGVLNRKIVCGSARPPMHVTQLRYVNTRCIGPVAIHQLRFRCV
jgi:hypothetical protein